MPLCPADCPHRAPKLICTCSRIVVHRSLPLPSGGPTLREAALGVRDVLAPAVVQDRPDVPVAAGVVPTGPVRRSEASERHLKHAVAVPRGSLQAPERPEASAVPAGLVLAPVHGADGFAPHARARPVPAVVAEVALNHLVLGMHPRCDPERAVEGSPLRIRRVPMLSRRLHLVALRPGVAGTREALLARLLEREEVVPLLRLDGPRVLCAAPLRHLLSAHSEEVRRRLLPRPLADWGQVPTPLAVGSPVEDHRVGVLLQHAELRQARAASRPWRAAVRHPQRCDRLRALSLGSDLEPLRAVGPIVRKPLVLRGTTGWRARGRQWHRRRSWNWSRRWRRRWSRRWSRRWRRR
mmetsp:Transcript_12009/g.27237  ORF Transcript_12009/g.27237 Transcript_12009/m.27237 type:complete len:352 (-) Transcript_12009:726-1781(-)